MRRWLKLPDSEIIGLSKSQLIALLKSTGKSDRELIEGTHIVNAQIDGSRMLEELSTKLTELIADGKDIGKKTIDEIVKNTVITRNQRFESDLAGELDAALLAYKSSGGDNIKLRADVVSLKDRMGNVLTRDDIAELDNIIIVSPCLY